MTHTPENHAEGGWRERFDKLWPHLAIFTQFGQGDATSKVKEFIATTIKSEKEKLVRVILDAPDTDLCLQDVVTCETIRAIAEAHGLDVSDTQQ